RDIKDIDEQAQQTVTRFVNGIDEVPLLPADVRIEQCRRQADYRIHGSADLVTHHREEGRHRFICSESGMTLAAQFLGFLRGSALAFLSTNACSYVRMQDDPATNRAREKHRGNDLAIRTLVDVFKIPPGPDRIAVTGKERLAGF